MPKDISKLQQHEIQAYIDEPYKKSGDLLQGYKIALDPKKWEEMGFDVEEVKNAGGRVWIWKFDFVLPTEKEVEALKRNLPSASL